MTVRFADQRILVTGGAGFVGSNLCRALLAEGVARVTVVDNLLSAERWNLPSDERLELLVGSVADPAVLEALPAELDIVFHLATFHGNQNSIADPLRDHANNTLPTLALLEHLHGLPGVRRIVYSSAGCGLGEKQAGGPTVSREDLPVSLFFDSPYQISKIVGELYGNYYHSRHGLPFVKARFQNVYGPGEILGAGRWRGTTATVWRNVVPTFVYRALKGLPLRVEGEGASRDFVYVGDIVEGLLLLALRGEPGQVYNLGTGAETPIHELAERVIALAGSASPIQRIPGRDWDTSIRRHADVDKARRRLGFEARVDVAEGLRQTLDWTRRNLGRIDAAIRRHDARLEAGLNAAP